MTIRKKKKTKFVENISIPQAVCAPTWDGASCIPPTLAGHTAILPCMNSYEGVFYSPKCKNCAYRLHTVAVCQAKTDIVLQGCQKYYALKEMKEMCPHPPISPGVQLRTLFCAPLFSLLFFSLYLIDYIPSNKAFASYKLHFLNVY